MFSIPNLLTICNLIAGSIGITMVLKGDPMAGALWVWIGVFFDYLDGMVARAFNMHSSLGKDLDSLADMVTFGVLPAMVIYSMMKPMAPFQFAEYFAFLIVAFSALRLAKFNNDTRQSDAFYGLPTPSNALFLSALPFMELDLLHNYWLLAGITLIFCVLLISEIRMFALKFKSFGLKENFVKYIAIIMSLSIVALFRIQAIPILILGYIFFSLIIHMSRSRP